MHLRLYFGHVIFTFSQITSLTIVYLIDYSSADQRKYSSSASLAFVWGIHRSPVNSPHKGPVTRKMFPLDDVIMLSGKKMHECFSMTAVFPALNRTKWQTKNTYFAFIAQLFSIRSTTSQHIQGTNSNWKSNWKFTLPCIGVTCFKHVM